MSSSTPCCAHFSRLPCEGTAQEARQACSTCRLACCVDTPACAAALSRRTRLGARGALLLLGHPAWAARTAQAICSPHLPPACPPWSAHHGMKGQPNQTHPGSPGLPSAPCTCCAGCWAPACPAPTWSNRWLVRPRQGGWRAATLPWVNSAVHWPPLLPGASQGGKACLRHREGQPHGLLGRGAGGSTERLSSRAAGQEPERPRGAAVAA